MYEHEQILTIKMETISKIKLQLDRGLCESIVDSLVLISDDTSEGPTKILE